MRILAIAVIIILAILSGLLGWQVYSMRQSASGQTSALSQRDAELARFRQTLAEKDAELAQLHQAISRANQIYLDVSKLRTWNVRTGQNVTMNAIAVSAAPQVNGTLVRVAASLRFPLLYSSPGAVRVLATAPNWGAEDKVFQVSRGVVVLQYTFPTAVMEATISLAP